MKGPTKNSPLQRTTTDCYYEMLGDTIVQHPLLTRLTKLLDTTVGREKLLRFLQYFCRVLALQGRSTLAKHLQLQFTMIRKVLRFAKPLNHIQAVSNIYNKDLHVDTVNKWFNIGKNLALGAYLSLDQINLLRLLFVVPKNDFTVRMVPRYANWFWLVSLLNGIGMDLNSLFNLEHSLAQIDDKGKEKNTAEINKSRDTTEIKKVVHKTMVQKYSVIRKLVWDLLDSFIVLNNLNYLSARDDLVGMAGVVTSLFGIQDLWKGTRA